MANIKLSFDGSCGPINPGGTAGYGYVIYVDSKEFARKSAEIGTGPSFSNNYAEFFAVYKGLERIAEFAKPLDYINVIGDSQLVIQILKKRWRAKSGLYYPAYVLASSELQKLRQKDVAVVFDWVPREENTLADQLSKNI